MKSITNVRLSTLGLVLAAALLVACADQQSTAPALRGPNAAKGGPNGNGDPTVTGTDPVGAPQDITLDVRVFGTAFDSGSWVDLARDGVVAEQVQTNATTFVSSEELVANITIAADAETALYDVVVTTRRGKKGIGTEMFEVRLKGGSPAWVDTTYTITDLGAAPGKTYSRAWDMAITEAGQVLLVGSSWTRNNAFDVPTRWTVMGGSQVVADFLSMNPEWEYGAAQAVTSTGTAVGTVGMGTLLIPVYWDAGGAHELDLGGASAGQAADASVIGQGEIIVGQRTTTLVEATYWLNGELQPPLPAPAGTNASAQAVNSAGTIAGFTAPGHPVVWHSVSGTYQLCDLGGGVDNAGIAYGISEPNGGIVHVVGASDASEWYATVWIVDLAATDWNSGLCTHAAPVRRLEYYSEFVAANAQGDAVGTNGLQSRATLLTAEGLVVELPPLKSGSPAAATAVDSDRTLIAGSSQGDKKATRAVLWRKKSP